MWQTVRQKEDAAETLIRYIYREHGRAMLAYATHLIKDHAVAEDVVQEALVRAWRHADRLTDEQGSIRGWLITVVRNIAIDRIRARSSQVTEVGDTFVEAAEYDHADRVVDALVVAEAMDLLSPEQRIVMEHVYLQGRSVTETAAILGIPPGTVKSRTFYALRKLRDMYPHRRNPERARFRVAR
ncbi:sigma-70 family RNA polymerase sigma factor [Actinoplanes sp. TRM88002]|uniref:Sigma-70 family RNA polymerase sigma factor n=2 Tax=Paractinoplanes hotanensis TaxID=2906497 RepID=A0ABT0YHF9_9ACTN|nr:sigma-70 family RNA polymerase sigma factor [Actinoplanes hotanensis]